MRFYKSIRKSIIPVRHYLFKPLIGSRVHVFQRSIADALNRKINGRFRSSWIYGLLLILLLFSAFCTYSLIQALMNLFNSF